jgi:hypothetical protein
LTQALRGECPPRICENDNQKYRKISTFDILLAQEMRQIKIPALTRDYGTLVRIVRKRCLRGRWDGGELSSPANQHQRSRL